MIFFVFLYVNKLLPKMDSSVTESNYNTWNEFTHYAMSSSITFLHVNIRSMLKNFAELEQIILTCPKTIHIIALTEVNLNARSVKLFELENYEMYSNLRSNRRGGGVILYIHRSLSFSLNNNSVKTSNFECISGLISVSSDRCISVCAVYRPPDLNKGLFVTELKRTLGMLPSKYDCVLLGDMNLDIKQNSPVVLDYKDALSALGFECGISQFTRIEVKNDRITHSCIDHLYIRRHRCEASTAVINSAPADHFITGLIITYCSPTHDVTNDGQAKYVVKISNKRVQTELSRVNWSIAHQYEEPSDIVNFINAVFTDIYNKCTIRCKKRNTNCQSNKWINKKNINNV